MAADTYEEHFRLENERWTDPLVRCAVCHRFGESITCVGGYRTTLCHEDKNLFQQESRNIHLVHEYHRLKEELVLLQIAQIRDDVTNTYLPKWEHLQRLERDVFDYCRQWVEGHRR